MKIGSIISIFTFLLLLGCEGKQSPISFNMEFNSEVTIPSSTVINLPFNLFTPDIETNTEATCEVNNTKKKFIKNITINTLSLSILSPEGEDFSFLKSIGIYINAEDLSSLQVAVNEDVNADATSPLNLTVTTEDLSAYIKKDRFSLSVTTITDELIASDYTIGVHANFKVEALLSKN